MTSPVEPFEGRGRSPRWELAGLIAAPSGVVVLAYSLWFISDRLLYIGPLDRATFGWTVVVPVWLATPSVAAWVWRGLDRRGRLAAASALGLVVGVAAAVLLLGALQPNCTYGTIGGPRFVVVQPLLIAAVIGGGLAVSAYRASGHAAAGRTLLALITGAGLQAAFMFVAILVTTWSIFGMMGICQRP